MGGGSSTITAKTHTAPPIELNKNMYNFIKVVGKGGFGRVWKVQMKKIRQIFALKVMSKARVLAKKSVQSVMNERQLLSQIQNIFIVNMIGAFQDRQNLYLSMDFLNGGDLRYHLNRKIIFNEKQIKFIIACIIEALEYLHSNGIIHRDIKPQNIIFEETGYCRVTDLGVAREWKLQNSAETSGTPGYMAPQVMCRQNHSFCADYFAVGVIAYELVMGRRPYVGKNRKQIRDEILARQVKIPDGSEYCSSQCIDFINKVFIDDIQMIQRKPRSRLGYNGINEIKQHPWLKYKPDEQAKFAVKKMVAPFIPDSQKENYSRYTTETEPSQLEQENMLLLKKQHVQKLFHDYEFNKPNTHEQLQTSKNRSKESLESTMDMFS